MKNNLNQIKLISLLFCSLAYSFLCLSAVTQALDLTFLINTTSFTSNCLSNVLCQSTPWIQTPLRAQMIVFCVQHYVVYDSCDHKLTSAKNIITRRQHLSPLVVSCKICKADAEKKKEENNDVFELFWNFFSGKPCLKNGSPRVEEY